MQMRDNGKDIYAANAMFSHNELLKIFDQFMFNCRGDTMTTFDFLLSSPASASFGEQQAATIRKFRIVQSGGRKGKTEKRKILVQQPLFQI